MWALHEKISVADLFAERPRIGYIKYASIPRSSDPVRCIDMIENQWIDRHGDRHPLHRVIDDGREVALLTVD